MKLCVLLWKNIFRDLRDFSYFKQQNRVNYITRFSTQDFYIPKFPNQKLASYPKLDYHSQKPYFRPFNRKFRLILVRMNKAPSASSF